MTSLLIFQFQSDSLIYAEVECGNEYLCKVEKFISVTILSKNNDYHTVFCVMKNQISLDIRFKFGHLLSVVVIVI